MDWLSELSLCREDKTHKGRRSTMADSREQRERGQGQNLPEAARQAGQEVKNRFQEGAAAVSQRAQEAASLASQKAHEFAAAAEQKTQQAVSNVGQGLTSLADTIHSKAPREGMIGSAASTVAQGLESSGRYLQDHRLGAMASDLGSIVRSYPLASVCAVFTLGLLLGRSSRR
jgi:hypothetical protein